MKIEILEHIMQVANNYLSQDQREQALLQIRDGGCGLNNSLHTAHAAYVASVRSSWEYLLSMNVGLNDEIEMNWLKETDNDANPNLTKKQVTQAWIHLMDQQNKRKCTIVRNLLSAIKDISTKDETFSVIDLFVKELSDKEFIRLQNRIQKPIRKFYQKQFIESLSETSRIRLDSCIGNREDASAWLEAMPQDQSLTIPDMPFIHALKLRLGVRFPELQGTDIEPLQCLHCKQKWLDEEAHHLVAGCPFGGHRQCTHDAVVATLTKILDKATRKAQKGTAIPVNKQDCPNATNEVIIPDIEVHQKGRKDLLDVTICDRILP
ncbi:MAG: hypothetical protein FJX95_11190, partial [Bacteroidetes bacterium]|nr:hypothetical protein [Bacteroidota bacterium]